MPLRFPFLMFFVAASVVAARPPLAGAGVIRGNLWLRDPGPARAAARMPRNAKPPQSQRGVTDAVLYVEQVPAATEARLAEPTSGLWILREHHRPPTARIVQSRRAFAPHVLAVPAGSKVEFENRDGVYHNAFSVSHANAFDLGLYPRGSLDTVQFEHSGVVNVHCNIHPDEFAYVVVTPNHAIARPGPSGWFQLPSLPPGTYRLHVWHPVRGQFSRVVEIPKHGNTRLDLHF